MGKLIITEAASGGGFNGRCQVQSVACLLQRPDPQKGQDFKPFYVVTMALAGEQTGTLRLMVGSTPEYVLPSLDGEKPIPGSPDEWPATFPYLVSANPDREIRLFQDSEAFQFVASALQVGFPSERLDQHQFQGFVGCTLTLEAEAREVTGRNGEKKKETRTHVVFVDEVPGMSVTAPQAGTPVQAPGKPAQATGAAPGNSASGSDPRIGEKFLEVVASAGAEGVSAAKAAVQLLTALGGSVPQTTIMPLVISGGVLNLPGVGDLVVRDGAQYKMK